MSNIDPNQYVDGVPLTPRDLLDRIGKLDDSVVGKIAERDSLKKKAKQLAEDIESIEEGRRDLVRCHRMNRQVYALVDGGVTTQPPSGLALWDAAKKASDAEAKQQSPDRYVAPIFALFGEGKTTHEAYAREVKGSPLLHVQTTKPGEWIYAKKKGKCLERAEAGPYRSAADAMLASLASVEWKGDAKGEAEGWKPSTIDDSLAAPAKAEDAKAPKPKGQPDDGAIYRASHGEKSLAVAQVGAPGPWLAYIDNVDVAPVVTKTNGGFPTSDEAKAFIAERLKAKGIAWLSSKSTIAPPKSSPAVAAPAAPPPAADSAQATAPAEASPSRRTRRAAQP